MDEYAIDREPGYAVVSLKGGFTAVEARRIGPGLRGLAREGYQAIVVDLSEVPYVDSAGLAAFVALLKTIRAHGGELRFAGLSEDLRQMIEIVRLDALFPIYPDVPSATQDLVEV